MMVCIRVANLNTVEATLEKGALMARLDRESWVTYVKAGNTFKRNNQKDYLELEGHIVLK